jgi:hypothetical protein
MQLVMLLDDINRRSGFKVVPKPTLEEVKAFRYRESANPVPHSLRKEQSHPLL